MNWNREEKIAAIAIPVRHKDQVLGCLNVVYVAKAMTIAQAVQRFLPALQRTAASIEAAISSNDQFSSAPPSVLTQQHV
ncbi:DNA-binding transcriptional activator MhpR [compost metagenome]